MENKIKSLKKETGALILAHYYQPPAVQAAADFIGDSLELSKRARDASNNLIIFCGVRFMAETAKILSPQKKIIIPEISAGCPMADSINAEQLTEFRKKYPDFAVVSYVNTNADVKAMSDVCCTSSNAVKVVQNIENDNILFLPDGNLARFVRNNVHKNIVSWPGHCYVHAVRAPLLKVQNIQAQHPSAEILAHPECNIDVIEIADFVGSTSQIIKYAETSTNSEFIVVTERGINYMLHKKMPNKDFYFVPEMVCFNMKKITMKSVERALKDEIYEIKLDEKIMEQAKKPLDKMLFYV